jgi:hypothetical protein
MDKGRVGEERRWTDVPLQVPSDMLSAVAFPSVTSATAFSAVVITAATVYVVSAVFTATAAVSVSSASASDRSPHSVNSVKPWSYYPMALFPQSVTSI